MRLVTPIFSFGEWNAYVFCVGHSDCNIVNAKGKNFKKARSIYDLKVREKFVLMLTATLNPSQGGMRFVKKTIKCAACGTADFAGGGSNLGRYHWKNCGSGN